MLFKITLYGEQALTGTTQVNCDSIVPYDTSTLPNGNVNYWFIGGDNAGSGVVEEGTSKSRDSFGIFHANYFFAYDDTYGTYHLVNYQSISDSNGTSLTYIYWGGGGGSNWQGEVTVNNHTYTSSTYQTGYGSLDTVFAEVYSTCGTETYYEAPFGNLYDYASGWNRLSSDSSTRVTQYSCGGISPYYSAQVNGDITSGDTGDLWTQ